MHIREYQTNMSKAENRFSIAFGQACAERYLARIQEKETGERP